MLRENHNSSLIQANEKGFVLALLPLLVLSLLCGLGLVVDSANMYAAQVKAGAAAEQGVLSSIGSLIAESDLQTRFQITNSQREQAYLVPRYAISAQNNLVVNGIERQGGKGRLTTKLASNLESIGDGVQLRDFVLGGRHLVTRMTGAVRLEVPVFFGPVYRMYSGNNSQFPPNVVSGFATAELRGSVFMFLVDMSSSQACPSVGPCLCKTNRSTSTCRAESMNTIGGTGRIRIEDIRDAIRNVINGLDARRDRISIVIYNNSAQVLVPLTTALNPTFDQAAAISALDRIVAEDRTAGVANPIIPNGNTNISDAILTARSELERVNFLTDINLRGRINMILLSDGAPTAMRVQPNSVFLRDAGGVDPDGHTIPQGDYINFQLSMETAPNTFLNFPGPYIRTLDYKRLVNVDASNTGRSQRNPMVPKSINGSQGYDDAILPACHRTGTNADPKLFSVAKDDRVVALNRCLASSWKMQGDKDGFNSGTFNTAETLPEPGGEAFKDFRYLYYLATVQAIERLAPFDIRFFTLSWGQNDTEDRNRLFNIDSVSNVKKEVLANLANDPYSSEYQNDPSHPNYDPKNDKWADPKFKDLFGDTDRGFRSKAQRGIPKGGTYVAIDAAGFNRLFVSIIQLAKLAVVSVLPESPTTQNPGASDSGPGEGEGEGEGRSDDGHDRYSPTNPNNSGSDNYKPGDSSKNPTPKPSPRNTPKPGDDDCDDKGSGPKKPGSK